MNLPIPLAAQQQRKVFDFNKICPKEMLHLHSFPSNFRVKKHEKQIFKTPPPIAETTTFGTIDLPTGLPGKKGGRFPVPKRTGILKINPSCQVF